jgi:CBS domain containing-hemolysin-like protein
MIIIIEVICLVILFFLSCFFSGSESALLSLGRIRTRILIEKEYKKRNALLFWQKNPSKIITTILIGNNTVVICASALASAIAIQIAEKYGINRGILISISAILVTLINLIIGEITPKIIGMKNAEKISLIVVTPLYILHKSISTFVGLFEQIASKLTHIIPSKKSSIFTKDELKTIIQISKEENIITDAQQKMMYRIFEFTEKIVSEVMVPREHIVAININTSIEEIVDIMIEEGFSRFPVYKDNLDNIVGVIYSKDLLNVWKDKELLIIHDIIRPPLFINYKWKIHEVLKEFQKGRTHLAIVTNDDNKVVGVITIEDLLEEIVGEIYDEYDVRI